MLAIISISFDTRQKSRKNFSAEILIFSIGFYQFSLLIAAIGHARGFYAGNETKCKTKVVEQKLIAKSANAQFESLKTN